MDKQAFAALMSKLGDEMTAVCERLGLDGIITAGIKREGEDFGVLVSIHGDLSNRAIQQGIDDLQNAFDGAKSMAATPNMTKQ